MEYNDFERNVMLARRYMVESIYNAANIEGIAVTFPETQTICDGMSVAGKSVDDIQSITGLKNAWIWLFNNIKEQDFNVEILRTLHRELGKFTVINAGTMRSRYDEEIRVRVGNGDYYYPPIPIVEEVEAVINTYANTSSLEKALELYCYIVKGQFFNDGNKRVALLATNYYMIRNRLGVLNIPNEKKLEYYELLVAFYKDESLKSNLVNFLEKCVIKCN